MATNLRLRPDAEAALRAEAERTHRTQQDLLREAVDRYLTHKDISERAASSDQDRLIACGTVLPPRSAYRKVVPSISLSPGTSSPQLLDREDRI